MPPVMLTPVVARSLAVPGLASAISAASASSCGVLRLDGQGLWDAHLRAARAAAQGMIDAAASDSGRALARRANDAYPANLVFKDSFAEGRGGPEVDAKRVIDLSPARLDAIKTNDPDLVDVLGEPLHTALAFFESHLQDNDGVVPKLMAALAVVTGNDEFTADVQNGIKANYRMVEYYPRESGQEPPRCGEHRDFGTLTLVFEDGNDGLEVFDEATGEWRAIKPSPGDALVFFGWCTQIRSNGRVPAALHRVVDSTRGVDGVVPSRTSLVLFAAPEMDAPLTPATADDAMPLYCACKAGDLKGHMARKWRRREGTLTNPHEVEVEAREVSVGINSQDAVIARDFAVHAA